jgi:hypothetical protein
VLLYASRRWTNETGILNEMQFINFKQVATNFVKSLDQQRTIHRPKQDECQLPKKGNPHARLEPTWSGANDQ